MLKFLGGGGPIKVEVATAEITIQEHGLKWWRDRGVKCPDCGETQYLLIQNQERKLLAACVAEKLDAHRTAHFNCDCGCKFQADFIEKEVVYKKSLSERIK